MTFDLERKVERLESSIYGNGEGISSRVRGLESTILDFKEWKKEVREELKHLVKFNYLVMGAIALFTFILQVFGPTIFQSRTTEVSRVQEETVIVNPVERPSPRYIQPRATVSPLQEETASNPVEVQDDYMDLYR